MDQRDSHCPYSLSSEITAKPTVLGLLVCALFFFKTSTKLQSSNFVFVFFFFLLLFSNLKKKKGKNKTYIQCVYVFSFIVVLITVMLQHLHAKLNYDWTCHSTFLKCAFYIFIYIYFIYIYIIYRYIYCTLCTYELCNSGARRPFWAWL